MEFRLTYEGPLRASTGNQPRARHKHEIRRVFHPQLRRLWEQHPALSERVAWPSSEEEHFREYLANNFPLGDYHFLPLVCDRLKITCGLDILFLRPEPPGSLIKSGDIDNRLKTLFDALRRPTQMSELGGFDQPGEGEEPFYCLLEDDSLVSSVKVDTDTLLEEVNGGYSSESARLVITVTLKAYVATWENVGLGS